MGKKLIDEEVVVAKNAITGEEIVKALELCRTSGTDNYKACVNCPCNDLYPFTCVEKLKGYSLDLIHRLQSENEKLTAFKNEAMSMSLYGKGRKDGEDVAKMELEQQKAEIARLTEERDRAKRDNTSLLYNVSDVEKENAELLNELMDKRGKLDKAQQEVYIYQDKNAELQKQVDELKDERENMQAEIMETEELRLQAVKDTAKEILQELFETKLKMGNDYVIYADNIKVFAKRYGVEVE